LQPLVADATYRQLQGQWLQELPCVGLSLLLFMLVVVGVGVETASQQ
jgi:hypothetical protein